MNKICNILQESRDSLLKKELNLMNTNKLHKKRIEFEIYKIELLILQIINLFEYKKDPIKIFMLYSNLRQEYEKLLDTMSLYSPEHFNIEYFSITCNNIYLL